MFDRSGLIWSGHLVGEPYCTGNDTGKGRFRIIWFKADHVLLRQIVDVVKANGGNKAAFPSLDATLAIKYSTSGAEEQLERFAMEDVEMGPTAELPEEVQEDPKDGEEM